MHRFYFPKTFPETNEHLTIEAGQELHHLTHVLRCQTNETVELFDGKGTQAVAKILSLNTHNANLKMIKVSKEKQKQIYTILACAIPKRSKFETIIEKATELGVDEIIPLMTKRTEVILKGDRAQKKQKRYEAISINAAKQCGRSTLPFIHEITRFPKALSYLKSNSEMIMPSLTDNSEPLFSHLKSLKSPNRISLLIGPEGDFTAQEYTQAHHEGAKPACLGSHVLKVETAALIALGCIQLYYQ